MYCPQCGAANADTAGSCSACGYDLNRYREQWGGQPVRSADPPEQPAGEPAGPGGESPQPAGQAEPTYQPPAQQPDYQQTGYQQPDYQATPGYRAPSDQRGTQQPPYQAPYERPPYQGPPPYEQQQYQRGYQQAPYPPGYYGRGGPQGYVPRIPSYLGWAIAVLILCFWPTGIVAVVYASRVDNKLALGDIAGAMESSSKAKTWCWITFGIAIAFWVIGIAIAVLAAVVGAGFATTIY